MTFGPDGVVEHGRRADLHGAAAEQEVVQRVRELGDAADAGEALSGKARVICAILASDSGRIAGPAQAAARDEAVDVHLELERLRVDQRQRRERVRRGDRVGAAAEHRARLERDVARRRA